VISANRKVYEFKGFRLDGAQRRLLHHGRPVQLKAKIFDLLLFLVENRGQLVEKDDLMREIWPNTIVEENNITVSMSILRKRLGEDRAGREFIETVPRRGYRFVAEVTEISIEPKMPGSVPEPVFGETTPRDTHIDSLAVLPIHNAINDQNIEYLSDGIAESIINSLSQIPELRVLARSTVFRFKENEVNVQEVGKVLDVHAVALVRVIRLGENLIIRSELVKVSDGSHLWGAQYRPTPADLLEIQGEMAKAISESLKIKLTPPLQKLVTRNYTNNSEAYNLYLRGRYFWTKYTKDWVLKSIEYWLSPRLIIGSYH